MVEFEAVAWVRQVLGEPGPHVRAALPAVLGATHNRFVAFQKGLSLDNATPYGLMWLGLPKALVEEFAGVAGVQIYRPKRAPYRLPVINGVPLVPWRYAKDNRTDLKGVSFGQPASDSRRSLFDEIELPLELPLGEDGLGDALIADLTPEQRQEVYAYGKEIKALATDGLVAVLAYASNPDALLNGYFGYATLGAGDLLQWSYVEELDFSLEVGSSLRDVSALTSRPSFDDGPLEVPHLRPRSRFEGEPTGEPPVKPDKTGADD